MCPATTTDFDRLSKDLRADGFPFGGPTSHDVFMQAVGMVNDHMVDRFRYEEVAKLGR